MQPEHQPPTPQSKTTPTVPPPVVRNQNDADTNAGRTTKYRKVARRLVFEDATLQ
jgi:hypothetical protein